MSVSGRLILKSGRDKPIRRLHPWIFSGAVARLEGEPAAGDSVDVVDAQGNWLALAGYSPQSQIRARVWTWDPDENVDAAFFQRRLKSAVGRRQRWARTTQSTAYREVHAESDLLPGLIVDRYADWRVIQLLSAGVERWRAEILAALTSLGEGIRVYERSDTTAREREGLELRSGPLNSEPPPRNVAIEEDGLRFEVDLAEGQKTGFYLDQRENRARVRREMGSGSVLDAFAYTGAFSVAALAGGAETVTAVEASGPALALAGHHVATNGFQAQRCELVEGDVFEVLRDFRQRGRSFNAIILDPPKFAPTSRQAQAAARGYKDINLQAFRLLRPGGRLYTFSCSGGVSPDLFQKIVAGAALDAGVEASIVGWLGQPFDHPVRLSFPEGRYLKGLVCEVL